MVICPTLSVVMLIVLLFSVAGDEETGDVAGASTADSDTEPFPGIVFLIPGDHVGLIIGRDGKNISEIEGMTNTSIKINKRNSHDYAKNGKGRILGSKENCQRALALILRKLRKKVMQHTSASKTISIPSHLCGRVIGKGGASLRAIESISGAKIKIEKKEGWEGLFVDEQDCIITGLDEEIEVAEKLIREAMAGVDIASKAKLVALIGILTEKFGFRFEDD